MSGCPSPRASSRARPATWPAGGARVRCARSATRCSTLAPRGGTPPLDRLAAPRPPREVLVLSVYRPASRLPARSACRQLRATRHDVRLALGSTGEAAPRSPRTRVASDLSGGKFQNLNVLLGSGRRPPLRLAARASTTTWCCRARFLDRLIAACERFDLALAQPAQTLIEPRRLGGSRAAGPARSCARRASWRSARSRRSRRAPRRADAVPGPPLRLGARPPLGRRGGGARLEARHRGRAAGAPRAARWPRLPPRRRDRGGARVPRRPPVRARARRPRRRSSPTGGRA